MNYLILGFFTGMSLILAIGIQNIFVIEQGLKKEFIFIVCLICSISDFFLIYLGILIFHYFQYLFTPLIEFILNLLLLIFLLHFIWSKIRSQTYKFNLDLKKKRSSLLTVVIKTLGFTYINPHVYSDTVFFLGNFSKNLMLNQKLLFGLGASISSILFFFFIGYLSSYLSGFIKTKRIWKFINLIIVVFMSFLTIYVFINIINFLKLYL
jgi:L-lysine exporter family protein LysE/ArgO